MSEATNDPQTLRLAAALLSAYEAIYCVELSSGDYAVYAPSGVDLTEVRRGGGFFAAAAKAAPLLVPEDRERFQRAFTEEALPYKLDESNRANAQTGAPVIAHGLARREDESSLAELFRRADAALYRDKQRWKGDSIETGNDGET